MKYLVVEIQKFETGAMSTPTWAYDELNAAQSKYHSVLAAAAISKLPCHSAVLMNETGFCIAHECFTHVEPEPEPEPEPEAEEEEVAGEHESELAPEEPETDPGE